MKRFTILLMSAVLVSFAACKKDSLIYVTGVEIDATELELEVGGKAVLTATVLPENATDKTVTWTSSAPDIASVDENGTISGLSAGNAVVTVTTTDGGKTAECKITVATSSTINGHEFVDLGLSVKWGTCNVGAESPLEYGDHFAWGEIEPKEEYTAQNSLTYEAEMPDISGDPEYDAARAGWGGTWRTPTVEEMDKLMYDCTWEWMTEENVNGFKVTGPNGNSIFLPAAGYRNGTSLEYDGEEGYYWTSTPHSNSRYTYSLYFYDPDVLDGWDFRNHGLTIRPVSE